MSQPTDDDGLLPGRLIAACAAVIGGCLGLTLSDYGGWPRLIYQPYQREWLMTDSPPSGVNILFFGSLLWAIAGATLAGLVTSLVLRRWPHLAGEGVHHLAAAWAGTSVALACAYFFWSLFPF